jgi:mannose-6-phosphate isomerase-like protein (cupin superfamily)
MRNSVTECLAPLLLREGTPLRAVAAMGRMIAAEARLMDSALMDGRMERYQVVVGRIKALAEASTPDADWLPWLERLDEVHCDLVALGLVERKATVADYAEIPGVDCPCGVARRAFADVADAPLTLHVTEIARESLVHYHKRLTEVYYFLECQPGAEMELDGERTPVRPGMAVMIPPGVRHRAIGEMSVLIVAHPKFDPADEWLD